MKTFKLYLCIALFMLCSGLLAQTPDPAYVDAIEKVLVQIDSAKSAKDMLPIHNQLERISSVYAGEWLPAYYIAYVDVQSVFFNPKGENNEKVLANTKIYLDKLASFSAADKSEVNTLWGYYYMALIMLNPEVNGQKYYNNVFMGFNKAVEQNPENPRAIFLLAFFEQNLPDFLRSKKDFCEEMKRAKALYAKEQKNVNKPYWGETFLDMISAKCK